MNKQSITDIQVKAFLQDFAEKSETTILEEGKEKDEILEIASAKGIELKKQEDLAGFKTIYTFADKVNGNNMRLPKEKLLKSLPGMIGKPVDIDHNRRYVVGHYIDYKYRQKDDMVIAYGVFYKSNFESEWEEAKRLFKEKKLATSYEIWCPMSKRVTLPDGTVELQETEIAGGALLFKTKPAFKDAKVLELAKESIDKMSDNMVFASKYSDEDILSFASEQVAVVEPKVEVAPVVTKSKCSNCGHEFDNTNTSDQIKCSECFAILDKTGTMKYPPQIIDFQVACMNCHSRNWLLQSKEENTAKIKCLSCAKSYEVSYEKVAQLSEDTLRLNFLTVGSASCPQCGKQVGFSGTHKNTTYTLKCNKCGLSFAHDVTSEHVKKISKIEEIVAKANEPATASSAIKPAKEEEKITMETLETPSTPTEPKAEVVAPVIEEPKLAEAKVEETVTPVSVEVVVEHKAEDKPIEAKVEEKVEAKVAVAETTTEAIATTKIVDVAPVVEAKKECSPEEQKLLDEEKKKKEAEMLEESKKCKTQKIALSVCRGKTAKKMKDLKKAVKASKKAIAEASLEAEKKINFYKENASKLKARRDELMAFANDISDEDLVNDEKFTDLKIKKENDALALSSEKVGTKSKDDGYYKNIREEIDGKAYGRIKRT